MIARIILPFDLRCRRTRLIMPALGIYSISDYKTHRYFFSPTSLLNWNFAVASRLRDHIARTGYFITYTRRLDIFAPIILLDYCISLFPPLPILCRSRVDCMLSSVRSSRNVPLTRLSQRRDCRSSVHVLIRETNISLHFASIVHTISPDLRSDSICLRRLLMSGELIAREMFDLPSAILPI